MTPHRTRELIVLILPLFMLAGLFQHAHAQQLPMCVVHEAETDPDYVRRVGPAQEHAAVMVAIMAAMDARVAAECVPPPPDLRVQPADVYCKFRTNVAEATWDGEIRWGHDRESWENPYEQVTGGQQTIERPGQAPETRDIPPGPPPNERNRTWCAMGCRGSTNATLGTAEWEDIEFQNRPQWFIPPANDPDAEQEYCWAAQAELITRGADCRLTEAASTWDVYENVQSPWRLTGRTGQTPFDYPDGCGGRRHGHYTWREWGLPPQAELDQLCRDHFNRRHPTIADKNEACRAAGNRYGITVKWNVGGAVCGEPIRPAQICDDTR